jgi:hypothetical protein
LGRSIIEVGRSSGSEECVVYVAKLSQDPEMSEDEAIHDAILAAMFAGHITEDFGKFWIVEDYIIIDKPGE